MTSAIRLILFYSIPFGGQRFALALKFRAPPPSLPRPPPKPNPPTATHQPPPPPPPTASAHEELRRQHQLLRRQALNPRRHQRLCLTPMAPVVENSPGG